MTKSRKKGMLLNRTEHSGKKKSGVLLSTLAALAACTSILLIVMKMTGFLEIYSSWPALAAGCIFCIGYGMLEHWEKEKWFYPCMLLGLVLLVWIGRSALMEGFGLCWNKISEVWTGHTGLVLPELKVTAEAEQNAASLLLFSLLVSGIGALISVCLVTVLPVLLAFLMLGLLLIGMVFLGREVSVWFALAVFFCAIFVLLCSGWQKKQADRSVAVSGILVAAGFLICVPLACSNGVREWAAGVSEQIHEASHKYQYETDQTTLPEGNFQQFDAEAQSSKSPALVVTAENPEEMYLRGFTGVVYEQEQWAGLDKEVLAQNRDLLYWLNVNEFHPNAQFERAAGNEKGQAVTIQVQNVGACSRYLYVPFNLLAGEYLDTENLNGDSVFSDGERTYEISVISGSIEQLTNVLVSLQAAEEEDALNYRKAESAYREFVYENYLAVPEEIKDVLENEWNAVAQIYGGIENLTMQQAQECVKTFLEKAFPEEEGTSKMELPLAVAEGTSYQYATTAVMTLRYFGIPARYAEGYKITEEMAEKTEAGTSMEVDSSHAGAWAEVYQDGAGWIPMALTPGLDEIVDEENAKKNKSDTPIIKEGEELEEEPENPPEEPEPEGGSMVKIPQEIFIKYIKFLIPILLLLVALIVRRNYILKKRMEKFQSDNCKDAVGWIIADSVALLEKLGLSRQNGSLINVCPVVGQAYGEAYEKELRKMIALNSRVLFSSHGVEDAEREQALAFRAVTLDHLKSNTKWYKRAWMKWIQCTY